MFSRTSRGLPARGRVRRGVLRAAPTGTAGPYRRLGGSARVPRRGLPRARRSEATGNGGQLRPGLLHRATADGCPETTPRRRIRSGARSSPGCARGRDAQPVGTGARHGGRGRRRFGDVPPQAGRRAPTPDVHHQAVPPSGLPEAEPGPLFQNHHHRGDLTALIVTIKTIMPVTWETGQVCLGVTLTRMAVCSRRAGAPRTRPSPPRCRCASCSPSSTPGRATRGWICLRTPRGGRRSGSRRLVSYVVSTSTWSGSWRNPRRCPGPARRQ